MCLKSNWDKSLTKLICYACPRGQKYDSAMCLKSNWDQSLTVFRSLFRISQCSDPNPNDRQTHKNAFKNVNLNTFYRFDNIFR